MDIGEIQRVWESEPLEEPGFVPEEPVPAEPANEPEQEPVPTQ